MSMNRREVLGGIAGGVAATVAMTTAGCQKGAMSMSSDNKLKVYDNDFFYTNGKFDALKAKKAYFEMLQFHGYPIPDVLRTDAFWVCDFVQGDFSKVGMGGIFWINANGEYGTNGDQAYKGEYKAGKYGYLGHEIFLLPGQMIPEHGHIGGEGGYGPKMESWQVRYGTVDFFGEHKGPGTETAIGDMSETDQPWGFGQDWFKSKYVIRKTAQSGELYTLEDPESWHFQRAGKNGAIVTEYATYHNHVHFSKPEMVFASTGA